MDVPAAVAAVAVSCTNHVCCLVRAADISFAPCVPATLHAQNVKAPSAAIAPCVIVKRVIAICVIVATTPTLFFVHPVAGIFKR